MQLQVWGSSRGVALPPLVGVLSLTLASLLGLPGSFQMQMPGPHSGTFCPMYLA